jgi:DNA-binding NarL/FixJ family response regulator
MARDQPGLALALVDLNMPGMERGYRLAELARERPALPLVVVSALTAPDVVRRTLAIPTVHAFVSKSAGTEQMRAALQSALAGRKMPFTFPFGEDHPRPPSREPALTPRMEQIRALLRQGMSNKLIARTLGISEGTVKNYMSDMFKALNVSNRTQAAQVDTSRL